LRIVLVRISDLFARMFFRAAYRITSRHLTGGTVGVSEILVQIDYEIAQLQRARALLASGFGAAHKKIAAAPAARKAAKKRKKRHLSPEGRKRIAAAVKRRWAEQKKAASGK
jgi:hypothetical protein